MLLYIVVIGIILLVGILFFSRYSIARVWGASMLPTLQHGKLLLVDRKPKEVKDGHVVIAVQPYSQLIVVKRVMYISPPVKDLSFPPKAALSYWIEGDNKHDSVDSRRYGFIGAEDIIGRVVAWRKKKQRNP
jgi:signal peptidase I